MCWSTTTKTKTLVKRKEMCNSQRMTNLVGMTLQKYVTDSTLPSENGFSSEDDEFDDKQDLDALDTTVDDCDAASAMAASIGLILELCLYQPLCSVTL
jgi:hypothetical protein